MKKHIEKSICFALILFLGLTLTGFVTPSYAVLVVDNSDLAFYNQVNEEIELIKEGKRGVVSQSLISRLESSATTTTIKSISREESTWHPNDPKGVRSHVVPLDTKPRSSERSQPTSADVFVHPSRIDPNLSLFKTGAFIYQLAIAADLNEGKFDADNKTRIKRAVFYRNAWCDSQGFSTIEISDRVNTPEYKKAKKLGLLTAENASQFPFLTFPE